ncbi:MAG: hypothetical protein ACQEQ4_09465 [Fibrobacterota bacterium]
MFVCSRQRGGALEEHFENCGEVDYKGFEKMFLRIPWKEEHEQRGVNGSGAEPTLCVVDKDTKSVICVSLIPGEEDLLFLISLVRSVPKRFFFILKTSRMKQSKINGITPEKDIVFDCFSAFFQQRHTYIHTRLFQLPRAIST